MLAVLPFKNKLNFAKYLLLHFEPGSNILLTIFQWLYQEAKPPEEHLLKILKKHVMAGDKKMLLKLKQKVIQFHQLDFTLLFTMVKYSCGLKASDDEVWNRSCSPTKENELEHLIFLLKQSRNEGAHPSDAQKNLTDECIDKKAAEILSFAENILKKAGKLGDIDDDRIVFEIQVIRDQISRLCSHKNLDDQMSPHLCQLIKRDLKDKHEINFKAMFEKELKGFSKPFLSVKKQGQSISTGDVVFTNEPLDSIFSLFDQHDCIVIEGGAGYGKTTLIKFLFKTWLCDEDETIPELESYETVFYLQCSKLKTRSISTFMESELPRATFSFTNSSSLNRQMKKSKILWLMDGYDECTIQVKGFLKEIVESLSSNQKLIITNRVFNSEIDKIITNRCVTLELLPLTDGNILEILNKTVDEIETREEIENKYRDLSLTLSKDIRTPLTLNLFIATWSENIALLEGNTLMTQLFQINHDKKMNVLRTRLETKTPLTGDKLDDETEIWVLYLCFQSYKLFGRESLRIIDDEAESELRNHPAMNYLIYTECISTFLSSEYTGIGSEVRFQFPHLMQQYYYSALFLKHVLTNESTIDREYKEFYTNQTSFDYHYIEIVKCLANIFKSEHILPTKADIICIAIQRYSQLTNRMDILAPVWESVDFSEDLAESFGKYFKDDLWNIDREHLETALRLFKYYQPHLICFKMCDDNELSSKYQSQFLCQLSNFPNIRVELSFHKMKCIGAHLPQTDNLNPINLTSFQSHDSVLEDYTWLAFNFSNLTVLKLTLTSWNSYNKCLKCLKTAQFPMIHIALTFDYILWNSSQEINHYPLHLRSKTDLTFHHYEDQYFDKFTTALDRLSKYQVPILTKPFRSINISLKKRLSINESIYIAKIENKAKILVVEIKR